MPSVVIIFSDIKKLWIKTQLGIGWPWSLARFVLGILKFKFYARPVKRPTKGGGGMYVPSLNFKTCHFIYWGGSHVAVWYFTIVFTLFYVTVAVSTHLGVTCHHICRPMSLFQGHVTCRNFTPPPLPRDKAPVNNQLVCLQPVGICNDNRLHVFINALSHFVIKCLCL